MNDDNVIDGQASPWFRRGVWAAIALVGVAGVLVFCARPSNRTKTAAELMRVMQDPAATSVDRHLASAALGKTDGAAIAQVVPPLIAALQTGDDQVRFFAAMALERLAAEAPDAKPALLQATADLDPKVRQVAVRAVGQMGPDAEAVAAFTVAARDGNADVRQEAFSALKLQQAAGAEALLTLLGDADADVRRRAASELSRLPSHVDISGAALHRALAEDNDPRVRAEAMKTLRGLSLLTTEELVAGCGDRDIRETAFAMFRNRQPGDAAAVPELCKLLKSDDEELAGHSAIAIGEIGPAARDAIDDLLASADDERDHVKTWVRGALRDVGLEGQYKSPELWQQLELAKDNVKVLSLRDDTRIMGSPGNPRPPSPADDRDMEHVANLVNLRYLDLSYTDVGDAGLAHLADLTKLEWLILNETRVTSAGLAQLARLTNLRELRLNECQVTDDGLAILKNLPRLETLQLDHTEITDAGLVHIEGLHDLKSLLLSHTKITDAGMPHLAGLKNLKLLYLYDTQVTDAGLSHLSQLDQLSKLEFDRKRVTTQGLSQLHGLTELRLTKAAIGDAELAPLSQLSHLKILSLDGTALTDAGLKHLAGLAELTALYLGNTAISDAGLAHLCGLKQLKSLELTKSRVTPAGIERLKKALPEVQVYQR